MILNNQQFSCEVSGMNSPSSFSIKTSAHAFKILSDGLYSDKIRAIIRELSCNAYDSHVAAGKRDTPFKVVLPTGLDSFFTIRDYGTGLSQEDMEHLYTTYFESTKQQSNEFIGALGLGSKSPFCYTEAFSVESFFNGVRSVYSIFIDKTGFPNISKVHEENTDEENGLKITIEVKPGDDNKWRDTAIQVLSEFTIPPEGNVQVFDITANKFSNFEARSSGYSNRYFIKQGNIVYPLDISKLNMSSIPKFANNDMVIYVNIGDVDFTASRESISYNENTIKKINDKIDLIKAEVSEYLDNKFEEISKDKCLEEIIIEYKKNTLLKNITIFKTYTFNNYTFNHSDLIKGYIDFNTVGITVDRSFTAGRSRGDNPSMKKTHGPYILSGGYSNFLVMDIKMIQMELRYHFVERFCNSPFYIITPDIAENIINSNILSPKRLTYASKIAMTKEEKGIAFARKKVIVQLMTIYKKNGRLCKDKKDIPDQAVGSYYLRPNQYALLKDVDEAFYEFIINEFKIDNIIISNKIYEKHLIKADIKNLVDFLNTKDKVDKINEYITYCKKSKNSYADWIIPFLNKNEGLEFVYDECDIPTMKYRMSEAIHNVRQSLASLLDNIIDYTAMSNIVCLDDSISREYPLLKNVSRYNYERMIEDIILYIKTKKELKCQVISTLNQTQS